MEGAYRNFLPDFDEDVPHAVSSSSDKSQGTTGRESRVQQQLAAIRNGIIGQYDTFESPFGSKQVLYADWTASGRSLQSIETYMLREVLPFYGNTHTTTSITGHQSSCFRHEARQLVAESVNAKISGRSAEDVVLFTGSGTTAAVEKLVACFGLHVPLPPALEADATNVPVVFVSLIEHHSNLLPWRESAADVVQIRPHCSTGVDLQDLEEKLKEYSARKVKIGAFSAASNVTGLLTPVDELAMLLHRYGAFAVFDYATAAPYVKIDMNPTVAMSQSNNVDRRLAYKDAIYFSGHKFLGGPGCPGVLVLKKKLLPLSTEAPATNRGGGTVFYVTDNHHRYLSNREEREEGGTPQILGDIRMGLVMHVKQQVPHSWIEQRELQISKYVEQRLEAHHAVVLLGRSSNETLQENDRRMLPIFSFLIRCADRFLHFHFVAALLNDLFGIQCRGGCMCSGPYAHYLLGIANNKSIEEALLERHEVLRPGFTRLSFGYWLRDAEINFIVDAVLFVAQHGWKFLSYYRYNHKTGEWAHSTRLTRFPERKWISNFRIVQKRSDELAPKWQETEPHFEEIAAEVGQLLKQIDAALILKKKKPFAAAVAEAGGELRDLDSLRSFVTAEEALAHFIGRDEDQPLLLPLKGPVRPVDCIDSNGIENQTLLPADFSSSAYVQKRSIKLAARSANETPLPRYLSLINFDKLQEVEKAPYAPLIEQTIDMKGSGEADTLSYPHAQPVVTQPTTSSVPKAVVGGAAAVPKKVMKLVGQAVKEWRMIEEGDRLLLGVSGGKDSLTLLHVLLALQKRAPVKFKLACATVDPQTESFDPSPLIPYMKSIGVEYHFLSQPIVELAKTKMQGDSLCAFCSRFKRGLLYACCRDNGYNKLVLAQHLDDLVESFMMSALHNGQVRTMKANYEIEAGDVRVIRPLIYVREAATLAYSRASHLPIINENCPACFEQPKERARMKKLMSQEESMVPMLFHNLRRALLPLMHDDTYHAMDKVVQELNQNGSAYHLAPNHTSAQQRPHKRYKCSTRTGGSSAATQKDQLLKAAIFSDSDAVEESTDQSTKRMRLEDSGEDAHFEKSGDSMCATGTYCPPCYELA